MQELSKKIIENQQFRKALAIKSFYFFFHIYFAHYIEYPTGEFQKEWCKLLQDWNIKFLEIIGFRGSAKTTYSMLGLPIWAFITGKAHFIAIISDTFSQSKEHIYNIKTELENNELLNKDFGPFDVKVDTSKKEEWQKTSIIIPEYDTKITAKSTGQKVRGIRYKQYRPELITIDDIENLEMIRTKEQRDKTYNWLVGDVIPAKSKKTKFVLIGNLLHSDAIMSRIKKEILSGQRKGKVREYPIIQNNEITWIGKYPNKESLEEEKNSVNDLRTWLREYLLKIVPEEGQIIKDEWIQYYDAIPPNEVVIDSATGIDLAISKKETGHFTAMVSCKITKQDKLKIYIMPHPVNERLSSFETTEKAKEVSLNLGGNILTKLYVEDVMYQRAQVEAMQREGLPAEGIRVSTDKEARLRLASVYLQNGTVLFPKVGCEDLIMQLLGFGVEKYDDICDAFTLLILKLMSKRVRKEKIKVSKQGFYRR